MKNKFRTAASRTAIFIIVISITTGAFHNSFILSGRSSTSSFTTLFDTVGYPEIKSSFSEHEIDTLNSITGIGGIPRYQGRLIRLYLTASGITDENALRPYMNKYESVLNSIKTRLSAEPSLKNLNEYNKAEFILHELHDKLFKTAETGNGAGYNIGISETFDRGLFNCYKSALIYNAVLEDMGISSEYVSVPEHIYSLININNIKVEVETTNRFGFDPWNRGKPVNTRIFDKPGISFPKKEYRSKITTDNVTVLVRVYNNRSLLYSGDYKYSGYRPKIDIYRSAALSMAGFHINSRTEPYIHEALLASIFRISEKNLESDPSVLDYEYNRYRSLLDSGIVRGNLKNAERNIEIFAFNGLGRLRETKIAALKSRNTDEVKKLFINDLDSSGKYIKLNPDLKDSFSYNTAVLFTRYLDSSLKTENMDEIISYSQHTVDIFNHESVRGRPKIESLRKKIITNICIMINNRGAVLINEGNYREALRELNAGIKYLKDDLKEWDNRMLREIEKARDMAASGIK